MPGRMVQFPVNGATGQGYLSTPDAGRGPGVLVIQEWWGLVDHIRDVADRFAREGFVALAPDFYHGATTKEPDEAGKLMMALQMEQVAKDAGSAMDYLTQQGGATGSKVGIIGFCMGGALALYAATAVPDKVGAVANFYGIHPVAAQATDLSRLKAPFLGSFAEKDTMTTPDAARKLEQDVKARGIETDFKLYPANHAFFNDTRADVYDKAAAEDAWKRTLAFFRKHLS